MYATKRDFEEAFGQQELADLVAEGASFEKTEREAASLAAGYIGARYTLPLATVPELVKALTLDITRYRLWDEAAPEEVRRRYEDALAQLRDLAAGRLTLPPDVNGAAPTDGIAIDGFCADRVFDADTLVDF